VPTPLQRSPGNWKDHDTLLLTMPQQGVLMTNPRQIVDRRRPRLRRTMCFSHATALRCPGLEEFRCLRKIPPPRPAIPRRTTRKTACSIHNLECAARELLRCSKGQSELPRISIDLTIIAGPSFCFPVLRSMAFETFLCVVRNSFGLRDAYHETQLLPKGQTTMLSLQQ